jgi:hypothetical protein
MFINATRVSLDEPTYRAEKRWSISQIKHLAPPAKPEWFHGLYVADPPLFEFDETKDMLFGTCCHAEFLEGKECHQVPDWALTSNGQRRGNKWEAYQVDHSAIDCLTAKEYAAVQGIRRSIESQDRIANLLWGFGHTELPIFAEDKETGLLVKGKLDKLRVLSEGMILPDFKVTSIDCDDARKVSLKIFEMKYHLQIAFYRDLVTAAFGQTPLSCLLIFARSKPPYTVRAWTFNENDVDLGARRYRVALDELKRRLDTNVWNNEARHNELNYGPDGMLLPNWAYTDDPADNGPVIYSEFEQFSYSS